MWSCWAARDLCFVAGVVAGRMVLVPGRGERPELPLFLVFHAGLPEGRQVYKTHPLKGPRGLALASGGLFLQDMAGFSERE